MFRKTITLAAVGVALLGFNAPALKQAAKSHFTIRVENVSGNKASTFKTLGIFNQALGNKQPGPAMPGQAFEFTVNAAPGDRLSFETMFGQSNDWFFAPDEKGIALFDTAGKPVNGDFSAQVKLWDTGTEVDEEPGKGPNQAPRQPAPNTGVTEHEPVSLVSKAPNFTFTSATDYVKLMITPLSNTQLRVHLEDVSAKAAVPTPIAPGVYVIHTQDAPFFTSGQPDRGQGLEAASEDGNPIMLAQSLGTTDKQVHLSPGVFVLHNAPDPLFTVGQLDRGQGLEGLAEDGDPTALGKYIQTSGKFATNGVFNMAVGASKVAPAGLGQAFEFSFDAQPGDYLTLATMFGDTNDVFFAPDGNGIALFSAQGKPFRGDATIHFSLWDAGTEINQEPFVGPDQAPREKAPNTGAAEKNPVQFLSQVNDGFTYPSLFGMLKVTITVDGGVAMMMMNPAMMGTPDASSMTATMAPTASK